MTSLVSSVGHRPIWHNIAASLDTEDQNRVKRLDRFYIFIDLLFFFKNLREKFLHLFNLRQQFKLQGDIVY